ncbi:hypothetical protein [Brevibacillus reuszeri]|uniref:hypothetical protein n=1 Tax=Brevibacillus reuszeri TaxID=54915 RepID=UPI003D1DAD1D
MDHVLTCTMQDGPAIVIGERVLASPASSALVTLTVNDRRGPLLIGGNQDSDIWDSYFFPLFCQDLASYETKSQERKVTGITLLVRNPLHLDRAVTKLQSTKQSAAPTVWNNLDNLPWPLNPLNGTPHEAAIAMVRLISCFSKDMHSLNQQAQTHVYSHTLLLKYLHKYRAHLMKLATEEHHVTNTYQSLFKSTDCTIDQWLQLYADPYLVTKATEMLESLVSYFEDHITSSLEEEVDQTVDSETMSREIIVSMRTAIQFMHSCYQVKVNIHYKQTFTHQARGTPLSYLDITHEEKILYPKGHPYSGRDIIIDSYTEQITDVIIACMYLKTNTVLRSTIAGESSESDPLYQHFDAGGTLIIDLADTWGTPLARAIMDSLWMIKIDQAISKRRSSSDHALYVTDATPFLLPSSNKLPTITRSRRRGVLVTLGIPSFQNFKELTQNDWFNRMIASFPNRIVPIDINDTQTLQNLDNGEGKIDGFIQTSYASRKKAYFIFRSTFTNKNKPILIKPLPLHIYANRDHEDYLITDQCVETQQAP